MPKRYIFEGGHSDLFHFRPRRCHIFLTRLCDKMYYYFWCHSANIFAILLRHSDLFHFRPRRCHLFLTRLCDKMYYHFWFSNLALTKSNSKRKKVIFTIAGSPLYFFKKSAKALHISLSLYIS